MLPQLSFEGATKRNRPNLKSGDVVYARVAAASRDMDPILTCVDAAGEDQLIEQPDGKAGRKCEHNFRKGLPFCA